MSRAHAKERVLSKRAFEAPSGNPLLRTPSENPAQNPFFMGAKNQRILFLDKVFRKPFGSWTSAPKTVDVRTKKCVFLRPQWWGEAFWGQECPALSAGNPDQKVYVYVVFLP